MLLLRRIMYTSIGASTAAPSRTSSTDAAGLGTAGSPGVIEPIASPSQVDELRDLLAVVRGVAKRELRRLRALEIEVQVVLPGEADAAVELDAGPRHLAIRVRGIGLGHRGRQGRFRHALVHGPRRVVRERLRVLDVDQ